MMLDQGGGSIINIASTHSSHIIPGCFPYPVAKHGLLGLTRALGIEYAPKGVRVNAIAPGYIETQLNIDYWNGRSEEHTSELQSLMRNSYAVLCLKKKKHNNQHPIILNQT